MRGPCFQVLNGWTLLGVDAACRLIPVPQAQAQAQAQAGLGSEIEIAWPSASTLTTSILKVKQITNNESRGEPSLPESASKIKNTAPEPQTQTEAHPRTLNVIVIVVH